MTEVPQPDKKSRSQIKRDLRALKELGMRLAELSPGQLGAVPLAEESRAAVLAAQGMARNSVHRHYRYLASLLADEDVPAIRAALAGALQPHGADVAKLHEAERWRDRLLTGDDDQLAAFVERHPAADRAHVRLLVRNARRERELDKPPKSARVLFQYVKGLSDPR